MLLAYVKRGRNKICNQTRHWYWYNATPRYVRSWAAALEMTRSSLIFGSLLLWASQVSVKIRQYGRQFSITDKLFQPDKKNIQFLCQSPLSKQTGQALWEAFKNVVDFTLQKVAGNYLHTPLTCWAVCWISDADPCQLAWQQPLSL